MLRGLETVVPERSPDAAALFPGMREPGVQRAAGVHPIILGGVMPAVLAALPEPPPAPFYVDYFTNDAGEVEEARLVSVVEYWVVGL